MAKKIVPSARVQSCTVSRSCRDAPGTKCPLLSEVSECKTWKRATTADSQSRRSFSSVKIQGLMSAPRAIMMPSTPLCSTFSQYDRWSYASPLPNIGIGARSSSLTVSRRTLTHSPMSVFSSRRDQMDSASEHNAETYICSLRNACSVADETDRASGERIATE